MTADQGILPERPPASLVDHDLWSGYVRWATRRGHEAVIHLDTPETRTLEKRYLDELRVYGV